MNARERNIAIFAGAALGLLGLNSFLVTPLLDQRELLAGQITAQQDDLNRSLNLVQRRAQLDKQWLDIKAKGLVPDQFAAAQQLANSLNDWALQGNLAIGGINPSASALDVLKPGGKSGEKEKGFKRVTCQVSVTGGMRQVSEFITRIQTAEIPVRISDMTISTKQEGTDSLELRLTASTIFLSSDTKPDTVAAATPNANNSTTRPTASTQPSTQQGAR